MSDQVAHLIHAQIDPERYAGDAAIYTFSGGLRGAGLEFTFSLFAAIQGTGDGDADALLRESAHHLLREVYIPLLPWQSTERPNPLDALSTIMAFEQPNIGAVTIALVFGSHVYLSWKGDGHAYLITGEGIEPLVSEDETSIASTTIAPSNYLLLCASDTYNKIPSEQVLEILRSASNIQAACDQLTDLAADTNNGEPPLLILVHRPE
jgi:hypothetical protein